MESGSKKLIVLLILGLIVGQHQVNAFIQEVQMGLQLSNFAWNAFGMVDAIHNTYNKLSTPSIGDVLDKTEEIIKTVNDQGAYLEEKLQTSMETLLTSLPLMAEIADDIRLLNTYIVRIDELYGDLKSYLSAPESFAEPETRFLTKAWTSYDGDDIQSTIARIYALIVPQRLGKLKKSLFILLAQESRGNGLTTCDTGAPPQHRLVEFFGICVESERRAFAMYTIGLTIDGFYDKKNYQSDIRRAERKLEARAAQYVKILQSTISISGRLFRRCDPVGGHDRGVTFYEFERFLQGSVVQESIFRTDRQCWGNCEGYDQLMHANLGCKGIGCKEGPDACHGRLANCKGTSNKVTLCGASGTRRYEYIQEIDGDAFGDGTLGCSVKMLEAWSLRRCAVCRCICVEDEPSSPSSHFISLRDQIADVNDNMVVTGLGFVMLNRILHIKIMQSQCAPLAEIVENSTSWVELENLQYDEQEEKVVKKSEDGEDEEMIPDKDVAILTLDKRRINLDTLSVPKDHAVTGVRFRRIADSAEGNIGLEIHATSFDAETGELDPSSGKWLAPEDMPYVNADIQRTEHNRGGSKNPLNSVQTNIDSEPYTFIDVDWSSFESDAAQTTIPLIDALPVISDPPAALAGVGLHHKAARGYGGFLTFVLEGLDQSVYTSMFE